MKIAYPHTRGLQPPILGETFGFAIEKGEFVQVLNVHRYHWITASTIGCPKGQVNVFDSLPCVDVPSRTKEQIAAICFMEASSITLNFPNM